MVRSFVNLTKSYVTGFVDLVRRLRIKAEKVKIKIKSLIELKTCILNCSEKKLLDNKNHEEILWCSDNNPTSCNYEVKSRRTSVFQFLFRDGFKSFSPVSFRSVIPLKNGEEFAQICSRCLIKSGCFIENQQTNVCFHSSIIRWIKVSAKLNHKAAV